MVSWSNGLQGLPLLLRAVRSGRVEVVERLLDWVSHQGGQWPAAFVGAMHAPPNASSRAAAAAAEEEEVDAGLAEGGKEGGKSDGGQGVDAVGVDVLQVALQMADMLEDGGKMARALEEGLDDLQVSSACHAGCTGHGHVHCHLPPVVGNKTCGWAEGMLSACKFHHVHVRLSIQRHTAVLHHPNATVIHVCEFTVVSKLPDMPMSS
jgi:hypothetical protein